MRVILVGPRLEENLSLGYLQSSLRQAGFTSEQVPFDRMSDVPQVARAILRARPNLVGLSLVAQRRYPEFQRLVERLRVGGFDGHVTAGGHFAGLRAAEVLRDTPGLDSILHHDGEVRVVALARALAAGARNGFTPPEELDGISWRRPDGASNHRPALRVEDLDTLPLPSRGRPTRTLGYPMAPMVTSRGCSGSCSFCSIHAWHRTVPHGRLRFRSAQNVADEMISLYRRHGTRVFVFHDDDFLHPDPAEAWRRCHALFEPLERSIPPFGFVIKCRPDDVEPRLFAYLKAKGLVRAYVGIESHSQAGLRALNRRLTPEANERALSILQSLGVYACFNLLIFHPDSSLEELEENLAFLDRHVDVPFDVARAELYARSTLEARMVREGRVLGDYRGFDYRIADPVAESTFRLFAELLWERHFGGASILHRAQELGYRLSLLRRLQPRMVSSELESRVAALTRRVNTDTVEHLRALLAAAQGEPTEAFRREFAREAAERVRRHARTWRRLSWELEGSARIGRLVAERLGAGRLGLEGDTLDAAGSCALERFARWVPGAVLLLGASCGIGDHTQVCDPAPPPAVSFSNEVEPTLASTCAAADCHGGAAPQSGLNLESGRSYDALVNVPSTQAPGRMRVRPDRPDSSYVIDKLQGTQAAAGGGGERMPRRGSLPSGFLSTLRNWIWQGAARRGND